MTCTVLKPSEVNQLSFFSSSMENKASGQEKCFTLKSIVLVKNRLMYYVILYYALVKFIILPNMCSTYVTLSVKTQLKSFFCDFLFSTKNHPPHGKEHSAKIEPFISLILTESGHVKDGNYSGINGRNQTLMLVISWLDFETLAWISQRGSHIFMLIRV